MAWRGFSCYVVPIIVMSLNSVAKTTCSSSSILSPNFYDQSCPAALPAIKRVVQDAVQKEPRMAASLLRLHFHDCFVNGCDGSLLLDPTDTIDSEKNAVLNLNSARGFNVVDDIKREVDNCCGGAVVSCADILAVAARDSVEAVGGPAWEVQLGRRDSTTASRSAANANIPRSNMDLPALIDNFNSHGLDEKDLVLLSAAHTLGFARCLLIRNRIYNQTDIDPAFAEDIKSSCPITGGNSNLSPLDPSPARFDQTYLTNLVLHRGLLHSDQALFSGGYTDELVKMYSIDNTAFRSDFAVSMIKMGNIQPLTGDEGEIRRDCRKVNH